MFVNNNNQQQAPKKDFLYRAKDNCTFNGKYYRKGETILLSVKKEVPHFELVEEK